jgi:uncharacterized membrane protein YdjX (TVP38/TMEM64 family)
VIIAATWAAIPLINTMRTEEGMAALQARLESYSGLLGVLVFVFFQALQVVIAVIPPIQIIGGLLFGWLLGGLLSFLGTVLGTLCIFVLVKRFGRPLVEAFVNEKHLKKYDFLEDEKKLTFILMILYIIPGIPKDVISYIVPLTKISRRDFFLYVMPCRLPAIIMSTVLGSNVGHGNFTIVVGVLCAAIIIGIVGALFKDVILNKIKQHRKSK